MTATPPESLASNLQATLQHVRSILRTAQEKPGGAAVVVTVEELQAIDRRLTAALEVVEGGGSRRVVIPTCRACGRELPLARSHIEVCGVECFKRYQLTLNHPLGGSQ